MGILSWILLGLVVGILAKFLMPGRDGGSFIITILLGIAGALVGGWGSAQLGFGSITEFSLRGIFVATLGAMVILLIYRLIRR